MKHTYSISHIDSNGNEKKIDGLVGHDELDDAMNHHLKTKSNLKVKRSDGAVVHYRRTTGLKKDGTHYDYWDLAKKEKIKEGMIENLINGKISSFKKEYEERLLTKINNTISKFPKEKIEEGDFVLKIKHSDGTIQDGFRVQGTSEEDVRSRIGAILGVGSTGFEILDIIQEAAMSTYRPKSVINALKTGGSMLAKDAERRFRKLRYKRENIREYLRRKRKKRK